MYVDFKEENSMQPSFSNGLLWMLAGIMMGLLVGLAMYYFANRGVPSVETANAAQDTPNQVATPTISKSSFAKDRVVSSPFGANKTEKDEADLIVASIVDKNKQEEVRERPNFSYYAVLPDLNVPVQTIHNPPAKKKEKVQAAAQDNKTAQAALVAANGDFVLQVASFRKRGQADKTRGRLARKGMNSYVQQKQINGRTWFRVMAGPVKSKSLGNWKATMASLGHKPIVIPIK